MKLSALTPLLLSGLGTCQTWRHTNATTLEAFPSLLETDLQDLSAGLEAGLFTSVDLVRAYTARALEVNGTLNVVTELNPEAEAIAATLDAQRKNGTVLGPLHGIPILIKNNIATADQMNNTAGSWSLLGAKVPRDSTMAAKLREAGVVILGKTNLSQWANYRSDNTSNGWSAYGGQTYGAYFPEQDPSGSSSGSGVASSIGLALATLGTETSGSILSPSDVNGLVGIKPTVGLTSRYLVIPISEHQDTVGPMARSVKDAAHVLQAIAGPDPNDNYTSAYPFQSAPDYVAACTKQSLAGARIGVAWNVLDILGSLTDQPVLDAFQQAVKDIEAAGATIVSANFTGLAAWLNDTTGDTVLSADFEVGLARYLSQLTYNPQEIYSLADLRSWTQENEYLEDWPERDTAVWDDFIANQTWNNTDPRFWPAYQSNLYYGGEGGILGALRRTNTSAVLLPTQLSPAIPALVGSPVVTVPMGFYPYDWNVTMNGFGNLVASGPHIPFGLSFMGDLWSEEKLIGYAYAYEQRTQHRKRVLPYVRPNVEIRDVVLRIEVGKANSEHRDLR
ncbi:putative amidase [Cercospora beticola]|uniref:Putative amidase n=1 Tax=Cercospora beticola TaxID=122368 RepID=A0A2G5HU34_CERBT|nr:putative amidase [Cercospora beticola]PIA96048.1 putative amidase [Cercospora beticola]WPB07562.1 hypothetical protein RHO25_012223 [Cercospora beticola]